LKNTAAGLGEIAELLGWLENAQAALSELRIRIPLPREFPFID